MRTLSRDLFRTGLAHRQPTRFKRHELIYLGLQKGYLVSRLYQRHIGWTYRITLMPYPGSKNRVIRSYDYCKTDNATAAERCYLHLQTMPDVNWTRKKVLAEA